MATKRGIGGGRSPKKARKTPPSEKVPATEGMEIASPPAGELLTFGELIARARVHPTVENLQAVADAAAEMEKRFNNVRREAEIAIRGIDASGRLFGDEGKLVANARLPEPVAVAVAPSGGARSPRSRWAARVSPRNRWVGRSVS